MNDTLSMLRWLAEQIQRERLAQEPEWKMLQEEKERRRAVFREKHRGNHALIREVNDLLDCQSMLEECRREYQFRLGLQMGLELRELDGFLPDGCCLSGYFLR